MAGENLTPGIERVKYDPTKILGAPGLKAWAGRISEEWDPALQGSKAAKLYREMLDSEPVLATVVRMITTVLQQADVYVQPHKSGTPLAYEAKELVEECIEEMTPSWDEFLEDVLSAVAYGWSFHEITYARRPDGRLGWASIDIRGQDSLDRWEIDDAGRVVGMWQMPPPSFKRIFPHREGGALPHRRAEGQPGREVALPRVQAAVPLQALARRNRSHRHRARPCGPPSTSEFGSSSPALSTALQPWLH